MSISYKKIALILSFSFTWLISSTSHAQNPDKVPLPSFEASADTIFGIPIIDPFKVIEDTSQTIVSTWIKSKNRQAKQFLESQPGYNELLKEVTQYSEGSPIRTSVPMINGDLIYASRTIISDNMEQIVTFNSALDSAKVLFSISQANTQDIHYELFDFNPSPDNRYIAIQLYPEGSDQMVIRIYDTQKARFLDEIIDLSISYYPFWLPDSKSFFYTQLSVPDEGVDYYDSVKVKHHVIGNDQEKDKVVLDRETSSVLTYAAGDFPVLQMLPDSSRVVCSLAYGISQYVDYFTAPLDAVLAEEQDIAWKQLTRSEDQIVNADFNQDSLYMIRAEMDSSTSLITANINQPCSLQVLLNDKESFITDLMVRDDALYIEKIKNGNSQIVRFSKGNQEIIDLPFLGGVDLTSENSPFILNGKGLFFGLSSWNQGYGIYYYDPTDKSIARTNIRPAGKYDLPQDLVVEEVTVYSHDSVQVPLTLIYKNMITKDGNNPVLLEAYGAYGESLTPYLSVDMNPWFDRGGILAKAHVRGGGEKGPHWHSAGKKQNKPNSWKDFIACGQYLIEHHYTRSSKLGAMGSSAGGITVGMAINEKPDLFRAAALSYPSLNPVNLDLSYDSEVQYDEFGNPNDSSEFSYLYNMDAYFHLQKGKSYPAVLLIAGTTDTRISPWEPAKYAARLEQVRANDRVTLLRVYETGHGTTGEMAYKELADQLTFFLKELDVQ